MTAETSVAAGAERSPQTLLVDTSALLCRYLPDHREALVRETIERAGDLVVTALAQTEVRHAIHSIVASAADHEAAWRQIRADWDRYWEVPLDGRCLSLASDIGARYGLSIVNSLHLAAFDRIPRPATLLTFDREQVAAATAMGFEVYTAANEQRGAGGLLA